MRGVAPSAMVGGIMLVVERVSTRLAESRRKENHMSTEPDQQFDPLKYKETTTEQWQTAAEPWHRWGPTLEEWLGQATEVMLEMAEVGPGVRVLDVAAGGGGQTIAAAKRVGSVGYVLATDISSNILEFASAGAQEEGLTNVETRVVDGEELEELEEVRGSGRLRGSVRAGRRGGCQIGRLVSELPRNGLGMRKAGDRGGSGQPENPRSHAVFTQVHNTL